MYIILSIIITIIIVEFYTITKSFIPEFNIVKNNKSVDVDNTNNKIKFDKYYVTGDKKINHRPGKIMILDDHNIFINTENYNSLVKKNLIYNIPTLFELEILNVNVTNKNIFYYYISNE